MKTVKYSKFRIILVIPVCNLTLHLTLPYFLPYLTIRLTLSYCMSYLTLLYLMSYLTLPYLTLPQCGQLGLQNANWATQKNVWLLKKQCWPYLKIGLHFTELYNSRRCQMRAKVVKTKFIFSISVRIERIIKTFHFFHLKGCLLKLVKI